VTRRYFYTIGLPAEWLATAKAGLAVAQATQDAVGEVAMLSSLGTLYWVIGQHRVAVDYFRRAIPIQQRTGASPAVEAAVLANLGAVYIEVAELEQAADHLERALVITRSIGALQQEGIAQLNLGGVYMHLGQLDRAVSSFEGALDVGNRLGAWMTQADSHRALAEAHLFLGQPERAAELYVRCGELYERAGARRFAHFSHEGLALTYVMRGRFAEAAREAEEAVAIAEEMGLLKGLCDAKNALGEALCGLGRLDEAVDRTTEALRTAEETGYPLGISAARRNLALVHRAAGRLDEARYSAGQALDNAVRYRLRVAEVDALAVLGRVRLDQGDVPQALDLALRCLELSRVTGQRFVHARAAHLAGDANPLGAGAVARLVTSEGKLHAPVLDALADAWVVEHGLPFAARAAAEMSRVKVHWTNSVRGETPRTLLFDASRGGRHYDHRYDGGVARRVRSFIAVAGSAEAEEVERALASHLADPVARLVVAYLVPHRQDWVDRVCDEIATTGHPHDWLALVYSLGSPGQLERALGNDWMAWQLERSDVLHSVVDGLGPAAAPVLASLLDDDRRSSDGRRLVLSSLAQIPTDEAFALLLDRLAGKGVQPTVQEMARRFPVRALRLLSEASGPAARLLLKAHLQRHPGLPEQVGLSPVGRAAVEEQRAPAADRLDDAVDGLPELLVRPPWTVERAPVKPVVVTGIAASAHRAIEWAPGEREAWVAAGLPRHLPDVSGGWSSTARAFEEGKLPWHKQARFFLHGPEELVTPLVDAWRPPQSWDAEQLAKALVVRFGERAIGPVLHIASFHPASAGPLLGPLVSTEVAERVADWASRLKSARAGAVAWVRRHPAHAARFLLPAAVGPTGPARRAAAG
ncbi:tetratricopeptide repeat protein, partial [Saccharothrix sp. MB29]|nr:tetratricopeptide repeat protein [Saccharothrix sp. MB29]